MHMVFSIQNIYICIKLHILSDILCNKPNRLLVVGGAGSLFTDKSHKTCPYETEGFPEAYLPISKAAAESFFELEKRKM